MLKKQGKAKPPLQLLETHASWAAIHVNHIFNKIFSDLTFKTNLPRLRNKARCDVVPTC